MPKKPYQRELKITISFVEDQDEAMQKYCEAVKIILFKGLKNPDEDSNTVKHSNN